MGKRLISLLLAAVLLLSCLPGFSEETEYRELKEGMSGSDVQKLKKAMYWLGYFDTLDLDGRFTSVTAKRVKKLQKYNGLPETGIADAALQELVFSGNAVKTKTAPKPSPVPGPPPTPQPTADISSLAPPMTEEGFLSPDAGVPEFTYVNEEEGVWVYLSTSLSIRVQRFREDIKKNDSIEWFEADIRCTPESPLRSMLTDSKGMPGKAYVNPVDLARKNRTVLAFADDHFGDRRNYGRNTGVIIRNGVVHGEKTNKSGSSAFPNLDVLAVMRDGSMKTFLSKEHTAKEYLEMGAVQTYAFGPILIQDGKLTENMLLEGIYVNREPRCALGMIAPWHYFLVVVRGRTTELNGVTIPWVAKTMLDRGVTEALNLDGGGTVSLVFMGELLNRKSVKDLRKITSITGFGISDRVPAP